MSSIEDFLKVAEERKVRYALLGALAVSAIRPFRVTHDVESQSTRIPARLKPACAVIAGSRDPPTALR